MTTFTDKTWKVTRGALVIEKGEKVGTLYLCNGNADFSIALASIGLDTTFWHYNIRYMSEKEL